MSLGDWSGKHGYTIYRLLNCEYRSLTGIVLRDAPDHSEVAAMVEDLMVMEVTDKDKEKLGDMIVELLTYREKHQ